MSNEHPLSWARMWPAAKVEGLPVRLRQGVWYRVVTSGRSKVVIEVKDRRLALPSDALEVRRARPERFTVVYRPRGAANPAAGTDHDLGPTYAVCPVCGARRKLFGRPDELYCRRCQHQGEIAWWETG